MAKQDTKQINEIQVKYVLQSIVGEDEDPNALIIKNDQMCFIKNKNTGAGVLTLFD